MKIRLPILLFVLISFFLFLSNNSVAFSLLPPPPVQPPPVVDTPPSMLSPGGTTATPNSPWALCQSLPQSCILGGVAGGAVSTLPSSLGSTSCPIGSILISNQCASVTSSTTTASASPSISAAPSSNGCLPGELAENNLCIRAQSTMASSQPQQQGQQPQAQQTQPQSVCPQGTVLENNLCFPQQQVPTANFTSSSQQQQQTQQQVPTANFTSMSQQRITPHTSSDHKPTTVISNVESFQRSENGTHLGRNGVNCTTANQSGSGCNTNSSVYESTIGKVSTKKANNGLSDEIENQAGYWLAFANPSVRNLLK